MKFIKLESRGGNYLVVAENVAWLRTAENGQTNVGIVGGQPLLVVGSIEEVAAKILAGGAPDPAVAVAAPPAEPAPAPAAPAPAPSPVPAPVAAEPPVPEPSATIPEAVAAEADVIDEEVQEQAPDVAARPEPSEPTRAGTAPEPEAEPVIEIASVEPVRTAPPAAARAPARPAPEAAPASAPKPAPKAAPARKGPLTLSERLAAAAAAPKVKAGSQRMMGALD